MDDTRRLTFFFSLSAFTWLGDMNDYGTYTAIDSRVTVSYMIVISRYPRKTDIFIFKHDARMLTTTVSVKQDKTFLCFMLMMSEWHSNANSPLSRC